MLTRPIDRQARVPSLRKLALLAACGMLAWSGSALADVKDGVDAWERGDYKAAIAEWRGPALAGDADAQFNLGQAYRLGRGVAEDLNAAQDWFKRAADQGHLQAADNYGIVLFQAQRYDEALPYIRESAERGEPRAQYLLGTALFNGDLVEKDWARAYALMTRASAQGLAQASRSLATMDQFISLADRQRGIALAADLETDAANNRRRLLLAASGGEAIDLTPPDAAKASPAKEPATPPVQITRGAVPPQIARAAEPRATAIASPPVAAATPIIGAPRMPPARRGPWRVQLGAFATKAQADALWARLSRAGGPLAGYQSFQGKAGALTRLQAGPFETFASAQQLCTALKASRQPCFAIKPK